MSQPLLKQLSQEELQLKLQLKREQRLSQKQLVKQPSSLTLRQQVSSGQLYLESTLEHLLKLFPKKKWNWKKVSQNLGLSFKFVKDNIDWLKNKLDWYEYSKNINVTRQNIVSTLEDKRFKWNFKGVAENPNIGYLDILHTFKGKCSTRDYCRNPRLSFEELKLIADLPRVDNLDHNLDNTDNASKETKMITTKNTTKNTISIIDKLKGLTSNDKSVATLGSAKPTSKLTNKATPTYKTDLPWLEISRRDFTFQQVCQRLNYPWVWSQLSSNPNFTWQDFNSLDVVWDWNKIAEHPNVLIEDIIDHALTKGFEWSYAHVSKNPNMNLPGLMRIIEELKVEVYCISDRFITNNVRLKSQPRTQLDKIKDKLGQFDERINNFDWDALSEHSNITLQDIWIKNIHNGKIDAPFHWTCSGASKNLNISLDAMLTCLETESCHWDFSHVVKRKDFTYKMRNKIEAWNLRLPTLRIDLIQDELKNPQPHYRAFNLQECIERLAMIPGRRLVCTNPFTQQHPIQFDWRAFCQCPNITKGDIIIHELSQEIKQSSKRVVEAHELTDWDALSGNQFEFTPGSVAASWRLFDHTRLVLNTMLNDDIIDIINSYNLPRKSEWLPTVQELEDAKLLYDEYTMPADKQSITDLLN